MDAGYGTHIDLRRAVTALGLPYIAGILSNTTVWAPGTGPLPPKAFTSRAAAGRPNSCAAMPSTNRSKSRILPSAFRPSSGGRSLQREGINVPLKSRFARLRIRIAHRDFNRSEPWPEEWLLIEWPKGEEEPTKYWLSTLPENIGFARLVDLAKLRWRIERDYQELKQEVGLGHFEGRGWRGFHHHATPLRRGLRIPDLRTGDNSPLRTSLDRSLPRNLPFPTVIDPEDPPLRPERHIPNSIATMRRRLADAIIRILCNDVRVADAGHKMSINPERGYDAVRLKRDDFSLNRFGIPKSGGF